MYPYWTDRYSYWFEDYIHDVDEILAYAEKKRLRGRQRQLHQKQHQQPDTAGGSQHVARADEDSRQLGEERIRSSVLQHGDTAVAGEQRVAEEVEASEKSSSSSACGIRPVPRRGILRPRGLSVRFVENPEQYHVEAPSAGYDVGLEYDFSGVHFSIGNASYLVRPRGRTFVRGRTILSLSGAHQVWLWIAHAELCYYLLKVMPDRMKRESTWVEARTPSNTLDCMYRDSQQRRLQYKYTPFVKLVEINIRHEDEDMNSETGRLTVLFHDIVPPLPASQRKTILDYPVASNAVVDRFKRRAVVPHGFGYGRACGRCTSCEWFLG